MAADSVLPTRSRGGRRLLPFWGQRAPAFRQGGEGPSLLPLRERPCSTAGRRTGADPVWGGLRASALCTPCRVCAAFRWASRQRVQQARSTPVARRLAIHPDASSVRRTPGTSLGILSFSREAPGFRHGECHCPSYLLCCPSAVLAFCPSWCAHLPAPSAPWRLIGVHWPVNSIA